MSSPHFYQADETFVQDVFGMKPNKEQHQTTIDINPVGISIRILKDPLQACFKTYKNTRLVAYFTEKAILSVRF